METVDLLIEARWVAPVVPRAAVRYHAVAVRDSCIKIFAGRPGGVTFAAGSRSR
jgi:hypothetical protein